MAFSSRCMRPEDWSELCFFSPSEFWAPEKMGYEFVLWLEGVRRRAGIPMHITSSYRPTEHNKHVGGAKNSAHMEVPCNAVDIGRLTNETRFKVLTAALAEGCTRIGLYANGSIHLDRTEDERPAPRIWTVVQNPA